MSEPPTIYQLKVVLLGVSPMIWRRLLASSDCTITDLNYILQIAMGWPDDHLNRFRIHGIQYGVYHLGYTINAATVRNKVHAVGQRIDNELGIERVFFIDGCERDWEQLPRPDLPLTVGIDGGYVHSCTQRSRKHGWFEVIAGKSVTAEGSSKRFAFVNNYDDKSKRRLFEVLKSQGMQPNQQVAFLSDGADTVRDLQLYMSPNAEHILDWFHITMRLTVMRQMAKGLGPPGFELRDLALKVLERIKWFLWNGTQTLLKAMRSKGWLFSSPGFFHSRSIPYPA